MFPRPESVRRTKPQWRKYALGAVIVVVVFYLLVGAVSTGAGGGPVRVLPKEQWETREVGEAGTVDYAVYLYPIDQTYKVSNWHDVPLQFDGAAEDEFNYVNEIPLGSRAKYETQSKLPDNPIMQDTKDGQPRFYKYGDTFFNYGALPQTWEDPNEFDAAGHRGDNDPVDVMELGSRVMGVGEVTQVRVLGALALLDQGEIDWKILCIGLDDVDAARIHTIEDLKVVQPGKLEKVVDWLINYKTAEGKGQNVIEPKEPLPKDKALSVVADTHASWAALRAGKRPTRGLWTGVPDTEKQISLVQLLSVAKDVAIKGGEVIKTVQANGDLGEVLKGHTDEGVKDPLTLADTGSHKVILGGLADTWEGLKVVSEEKAEAPGGDDYLAELRSFEHLDPGFELTRVKLDDVTVWVDPLDATKEFTENKLEYVTVMVCLVHKGKAVGGVVHYPFSGKTAWGLVESGYGGFELNSTRRAEGAPPRVVVSLSHPGVVDEPIEALGGKKVGAAGSGYKTMYMIEGKADLYLHRTKIKKWDMCAPNGILNSVGGLMTDWDGNEFDYSYGTEALNDKGLLVSLRDHAYYVDTLKSKGVRPGNPDDAGH